MPAHRLATILHLDGAANLAAGAVLFIAGGWLAEPLGLASGWPLRLLGVLLVAYGVENHLVARRPSVRGLTGLAVVDVGFAIGVVALAVGDPTGAEAWARGALVAVGFASLGFGLAKFAGRRVVSAAPARRRAATG